MADFCPSLWGGKNWPPIAFSPKTRMIYIPANENLCGTITGRRSRIRRRQRLSPARRSTMLARAGRRSHRRSAGVERRHRQARVDAHLRRNRRTGDRCSPPAAALVFSGGTNDRKFHAFDATTGKLLWEFPTNSGIIGQPSSFMVDGKQYIAVQSGWGVDSRRMQARLNRIFPGQIPRGAGRRRDLGVRPAAHAVRPPGLRSARIGLFRHEQRRIPKAGGAVSCGSRPAAGPARGVSRPGVRRGRGASARVGLAAVAAGV